MTTDIDLRQLEKKTWRSFYQDGLVDIEIGMILIVSMICQLFNTARFYLYALYIIPAASYIIAQRIISRPRLGMVKFSKQRNRKRHWLSIIITTSTVFLLILTMKGILQKIPMTPVFIGIFILTLFSIMAFFLNLYRLYFYGVLITLSFAASEMIIIRTGIIARGAFVWLVSGIIIMASGIWLLVKFLRKYPIAAIESSSAGGMDEGL